MKTLFYIVLAGYLFWHSIICFLAFFRNGSQKTFTMPDNDILMGLIFGKRNISRVNNFKGAVITLIVAVGMTILLIRGDV